VDTRSDVFFDLAKAVREGTITRRTAIQRGAAVGLGTASLMALGTMPVAAQDATPMAAQEATPNPNAKQGGVLRVGLQADPAELDPHKTQLTAAWHVIEHVYNGLVATNSSLEPIPSLAESWDISEDGLTYTFHLRQGVKFHNGREVVAEDVKFSYERILDPETASPAQPDLENVESIEATDDATVTITLKAPDSSFLAKLMGSSLAIVPSEVVEAEGDLMNIMVGTGPFKFVEYVPNSMLVVEANPDYWEEGLPYLDGIEFQIVPENTARTTALSSGTVDFIEYAPAQDMPTFENDETLKVSGDQNTNVRFLAFNVEKEPFTDLKVRQAISMVIDRAPIIDAAMFGAAQPTNILFPATYWAGYESEIPEPDIEGAKALLAEAGYEDGFTTELHSWSQYAFLSNAAVVIQEQLKQVNIEAELRFEENAVYLENYFASNFDMSVTGTSAYVDPNDVVQNNFQSTSTTNASQYNNPEMDELIMAGMTETDQAKRQEIYVEIQELLKKDLPWIPLFIASQYEAMKTFVMDYEHYPTGSNVSLKRVWLDQ
jgi:peptide/nickel transport system substrate-binding protein